MTTTYPTASEWADIWSEYRFVFERLDMDHDAAPAFIAGALETAMRLGISTDGDTIADALKEFAVLADERGQGEHLRAELHHAVLLLSTTDDGTERHTRAVRMFGCRAEDLGPVLAHLEVPR